MDAFVPSVLLLLLLLLLRTLTSLNSNCSGSSAFALMSLSTPAWRSVMFFMFGCDCRTTLHTSAERFGLLQL
jgi:hypothetical protein